MSLDKYDKSFYTMGDDISYNSFMGLYLTALFHHRHIRFPVSDVDHFEADGYLTNAVMKNKRTVFSLDSSINAVALLLPGNHCDRCHKSSIANLHRIDALIPGITPYYCTSSNEIMKVSKHEMAHLKDIMFCYHPFEGVRRRKGWTYED